MSPIARMGDQHICPQHGINAITSGSSQLLDGKPIATAGDSTTCGGIIISGSGNATIDGKPIAIIGSKTSCGGLIATGSENATA